uniref:Down syndrome cell adhesion molecule n=1 Tax=Strigamia maritima TaxID=126957 RepID=T1J582_STRMM
PRGTVQPRITDSKQIVTARQGERVALPCAAQGYPIPFYNWYTKATKSQLVPLTMTDSIRQISGTIIITRAQVSDTATYVCVANNSVGSERVETLLTVTVPLSAYIKPARQTIDIGKPANFTCVISGVPIRKVVWFKNSQSLVSNEHFRLSSIEYLQIVSVKREDKGMYQCHVKNDNEYVQATAELQLGDAAPELISKFHDQTVQPGSSVSLQCIVVGNPPPQISWTVHDSPVPIEPGFSTGTVINLKGEVVGSLNISHIRTEDGGEYKCSARNRAGGVEHSAKLNVFGRPYIRPMPKLSIVDGNLMYIKCPVSGYPIESITWEKDGMTLPVNHRQEVFKNGTLMITNVQLLTDSGKYSCVARNSQGHTARRDLEVKVMAPPKIIPFSFQDDELSEGMRAQISCAVRQGEQPISIHWLKNGSPIAASGMGGGSDGSSGSGGGASSTSGVVVRNFDEFTSILRIEAVSVKHNGNYTCIASNAAAAVNYTATLRVNVPPLLNPLSFQDDHLYEGAHARVTCGVRRGDLPITFTWLKDGLPIPAGTGVAIREVDEYASILTIGHVARRHSGNYTCTVSNAASSVNRTAELTVNVPPQWITEPQDTAVLVGSRLQIDCSATGFPRPSITWKKAVGNSPGKYQGLPYGLNGIAQHSNGTLSFVQATEADRGYYLCQASNGIGAGLSKVVFFNVHIPARFDIKSKNQTVKKNQMASLSCQATGDNPNTITWLANQQQISITNPRYKIQDTSHANGMTSEMIIPQAERGDTATYHCQVNNRYGQDEAKIHLIVQEAPDAPRNVRVLDQSKRAMQITWTEPFSGNNLIQRYIVQYKLNTDTWQLESQNSTVSGTQTVFTVGSLLPASIYNLRVLAENDIGLSQSSEVITVTTSEEAPTGPPQKVKVDAVDSNTLKVSWKPPKQELWNGNIQGYYVGYKVYDSPEPYVFSTVEVHEGSEEQLQLHLTNLLKFMRYGIVVQSFNRLGPGPKSDEVVALTSEDVPDKPPSDVQCTTVSAQSLHVGWESPPNAALNGVLQGYKVLYAPANDWNDVGNKETKITTALKTTLHGLERNTNYSIQVLAFTRVGDGVKSESVYCQTNEDGK